ncbi:MAG: hypothetical protein AAGC81_04330 [Pseudomonadota bacterium]
MSPVNVILLVSGGGASAFALWGLYTEKGQKSFEGMAGIIPLASGLLGAVLLGLALLLIVYQVFMRSAEATEPVVLDPTLPRFTSYNHWVLLAVLALVLLAFELFCRMTLGSSGALIALSWTDSSSFHWGWIAAFLLFLFIYALIVVDTLATAYARHYGSLVESVSLGLDLHNETFRLDLSDPENAIIPSPGGTFEQDDRFEDRFADLHREKGLRFGQRPQDVLGWQSFTTKAAIMAAGTQWFFQAVLGLFFIGLIGSFAAHQGLVEDSEETALVTGLSWLWQHHPVTLLVSVTVLATFSVMLARLSTDPDLLAKLQPGAVYSALPDHIRPGASLSGQIVDHATEKKRLNGSNSAQSTHHNLLVRFNSVFAHPVWLRFSLDNTRKNRAWMKAALDRHSRAETFIVQNNLAILPTELHWVQTQASDH